MPARRCAVGGSNMIVWRRLADLVASDGAAALVGVHAVKGSAPREAGARMIVRPDGAFHGTIGGGRLEWEMLARAREALEHGRGPARFVDQALGPDLGQCCGGRVTVLIETFDHQDAAELEALARAEAEGIGQVEAWIEDGRVRRRAHPSLLRGGVGVVGPGEGEADASSGRSRGPQPLLSSLRSHDPHPQPLPPATRGARWREPLSDPLTPIALFGAGHVGRALVLALAPLPFAVRWIDSREGAFPAHIPGNVTPVLAADPEAEIARIAADSLVVVMTHEHPLDLAITAAALGSGFPFVGLIGSDTKRARFEKRFRELGLSEERIASLACPIGLAGIAGKEPAVVAASAVAQLLQVREKRAANSGDLPSAPT